MKQQRIPVNDRNDAVASVKSVGIHSDHFLHWQMVLFAFFSFMSVHAQVKNRNVSDTLSPLRVVQKYVSGEKFDDKFKYFCCEMEGEWRSDSTLGMLLPSRVQRDSKLIFQDSGHAVVDVWLHDSATSKNYYFYLLKSRVWTVYAIRTLLGLDELEQQILSLDSVPQADRKKYVSANGFTWQFEYDNLSLWTADDSLLAQNFRNNQKEFAALQTMLVKKKYYGVNDSLINTVMKDKKMKKKVNALLLRDISSTKKYPGAVFYMIGGTKDNSVGYMYQPDPKKVPHMTEKHFILLLPLGNGWYLFKTT